MQILLIALIVGIFGAILFLNVYFRVKVFKAYKVLVQNRIEFKTTDIFNKQKMQAVKARYPKHEEEIATFVNNIKFSMKCASALIVLITAFAAVLMFMREGT